MDEIPAFTDEERAAVEDTVVEDPPEKTVEDPAQKKNELLLKQTNADGSLQFQTVDDIVSWAQLMLRDNMVPKGYRTVGQVLAAIQVGAEVGLKPFQAMRNLAVDIDGSPKLHTDGPLAIVQKSGELEDIIEWYFDSDGKRINLEESPLVKPYGALCKTLRRGYETWHVTTYDLGKAEEAGLYPGKNRSGEIVKKMPWNSHTAVMLQRRARGINLVGRFADVLSGCEIEEYHDMSSQYYDERTVKTVEQERAEDLTSKLLGGGNAE